jgi:hypothetical protein
MMPKLLIVEGHWACAGGMGQEVILSTETKMVTSTDEEAAALASLIKPWRVRTMR